jgi:hypothetical protein
MSWFNAHWEQILGVACVVVMLVFGRKKLLPGVGQSKFLLWLAFAVTAACGLVLGWALSGLMAWLTSRGGWFGGVVGNVGAIIAVAAGWWSVTMLVALVRDLADGKPDGDARQAALWFPLLAIGGISSVWGIVQHPRGIGTGLAAAVIGGISVIALHRIVKSALAGKKAAKAWRWFAAGVALLAGLLIIPLYAFADTQLAAHASGNLVTSFRVLSGVLGLALLLGAAIDLKDKVPDAAVRAFLAYGLPALILTGAFAVGWFGDHAQTGGQVLLGGMR